MIQGCEPEAGGGAHARTAGPAGGDRHQHRRLAGGVAAPGQAGRGGGGLAADQDRKRGSKSVH